MTGDSHYKAVAVPVDGTVALLGARIGGFLAATSGSITITIIQGEGAPPLTLPTFPVTAGEDIDIPIFVGTTGRSTFVASGGASGILFAS